MEILPFGDPLVVLELDGEAIWDALESGLSTWPAQEGQVISHLHGILIDANGPDDSL